MMVKLDCRNCGVFGKPAAIKKANGRWVAKCKACGDHNPIDVEDYLLEEGTLVELPDGRTGRIQAGYPDLAGTLNRIPYDIAVGDNTVREIRAKLKIAEDWRLTIQTKEGIRKVCHYPRNQEGSNVPCYNCVDAHLCSRDILYRLWQYERLEEHARSLGTTLDELLDKEERKKYEK